MTGRDRTVDAVFVAAVNRYLDSLTLRQALAVALGHIARRSVFGAPYADAWLYERARNH